MGTFPKEGRAGENSPRCFLKARKLVYFSYQFFSILAYRLLLGEITLFTSRLLQAQVEHASVEAQSSGAESCSCFCGKLKEYVEMVNAEDIGGMLTAFYR